MTQDRPRASWATIFCLCVPVFILHSAMVMANGQEPLKTGMAPILVEADHFQMDLNSERAMWRGDVTAIQGNSTFRAASLTLYMDQLQGASASNTARTDNTTSATNGYELSAEKLTYDLDQGRIVGHGKCELRRGVELIRAERIVYEIAEQIAIATPSVNGRVQVHFLSNSEKPLFPANGAAPTAAE